MSDTPIYDRLTKPRLRVYWAPVDHFADITRPTVAEIQSMELVLTRGESITFYEES